MNVEDFEGSLILEELASRGRLEDFYDAIDSDNLGKIVSLLREVDIDEETIQVVLGKIERNET